MPGWQGFDPEFDDTRWDDTWARVPLALIPPGVHPSGYRVERRLLYDALIFDRPYRLSEPFDARLLYDPAGRLWMSNTPQEHLMMCNNGRASAGHVLIGGLGLGVYPQYAAPQGVGAATRFTVIEQSAAVRAIVLPTLEAALSVPIVVEQGEIGALLAGPVHTRYDTIFLDTWETLDAAHLPAINRLRDLALRHLAPGGRVLLWGYRWMVRLFEDACRALLSLPPARRAELLAAQEAPVRALLVPVLAHFAADPAPALDAALAWCRAWIVQQTER